MNPQLQIRLSAHVLTRTLRRLSAASLLALILIPGAASAQTSEISYLSDEKPSPELLIAWRTSIAQTPLPKQGCFQTAYPSKQWNEVGCVAAPNIPMPPHHGSRPLVVGNGNDVSAQAPSGFISTAIGSFDTVTNVTSESGPIGNTGPAVANAYTLQMNTNFFSSTVCSGAGTPALCQGWQQFVFWNTGSSANAFIQYWIIKYNNPCPAGQSWNQFSFTGSTDIYCWKNNTGGAVSVPNQPITNLGQLSLNGTVSATADSVTVAVGTTAYARAGDNAVNAAGGWQIAEFNVFGAGGNSAGGGQAAFNAGADIVTRTRITYGGRAAPNCVAQGFTAETNNLSFGPTPPAATQPGPAVIFRQSTAGGATSNCAAATSVGDTHLLTDRGLFYDFQASGDYVLAQTPSDFVVQARQVSGAPTWPNASVNKAVATRMGKDTVAVCLNPVSIYVDGKSTELGDGTTLATPDEVDITRVGNVYFITSPTGDSVRVTINPGWMDVLVGFGRWPVNVTGLLASQSDVNKISARDGTVLTNPFSFADLYHRYGDSWRVPSNESLLSACGTGNIEHGNPSRTFYARDLDPQVYERTRGLCVGAGVEGPALQDACTLDVAVLADPTAAHVFVNLHQPVAVAIPGTKPEGGGGGLGGWQLLLVVILIVIILALLVLLFLTRRRSHEA